MAFEVAPQASDTELETEHWSPSCPDVYRVGEARERRTGGIGLGLAIADRAIQAHKGTITARNKNGGLEVEIILNRSDRTKA